MGAGPFDIEHRHAEVAIVAQRLFDDRLQAGVEDDLAPGQAVGGGAGRRGGVGELVRHRQGAAFITGRQGAGRQGHGGGGGQ